MEQPGEVRAPKFLDNRASKIVPEGVCGPLATTPQNTLPGSLEPPSSAPRIAPRAEHGKSNRTRQSCGQPPQGGEPFKHP
eukprot:2441445-Alexandrium_andersonii.AAC.1